MCQSCSAASPAILKFCKPPRTSPTSSHGLVYELWPSPPAPLQTMIEKNEIMILCSICTLIFVSGGRGRCRACHMHLCQLRSPRGGRLDSFYFCVSFRRVYFWARKRQAKLETQIRTSPVRFLPRMLFVLK